MFTVLFENQYNKQFCSDYYFKSAVKAKEYLIGLGYVESNRIFYKDTNVNNDRAYVQPLKGVE